MGTTKKCIVQQPLFVPFLLLAGRSFDCMSHRHPPHSTSSAKHYWSFSAWFPLLFPLLSHCLSLVCDHRPSAFLVSPLATADQVPRAGITDAFLISGLAYRTLPFLEPPAGGYWPPTCSHPGLNTPPDTPQALGFLFLLSLYHTLAGPS